jgi:hypothetical protein
MIGEQRLCLKVPRQQGVRHLTQQMLDRVVACHPFLLGVYESQSFVMVLAYAVPCSPSIASSWPHHGQECHQ